MEFELNSVLYDAAGNAIDASDFGFVKEQIHILLISIVNSEICQWITEVLLTKFAYQLVSLRVRRPKCWCAPRHSRNPTTRKI